MAPWPRLCSAGIYLFILSVAQKKSTHTPAASSAWCQITIPSYPIQHQVTSQPPRGSFTQNRVLLRCPLFHSLVASAHWKETDSNQCQYCCCTPEQKQQLSIFPFARVCTPQPSLPPPPDLCLWNPCLI